MIAEQPASENIMWWSLVAVALYVVTLLPYVAAWRAAGNDVVFLGLLFDVPDHAQYWAWVRASHQGLFISNTLTPEPNPATFMYWELFRTLAGVDMNFQT